MSTIHSFLYKHVVKPYIFLVADEFDLNVQKMDGHDIIRPQYTSVKNWLENHVNKDKLKHPNSIKQLQFTESKKASLRQWLSNLQYKFKGEGTLILVGKNEKAGAISKVTDILAEDLISYKKLSWKQGKIDHDDVLFFSHELLTKYPFILNVLRAKFPYFFLDEAQDTNPIQTKIIKLIAEEETIVGIIGDPVQSIFEFQGASIDEFMNFKLGNMQEYEILENRRSSNQIIDLLNKVRTDIMQTKFKNIDSESPTLFIGDIGEAYQRALELCGDDVTIHTLSRDNSTANAMKSLVSLNDVDSKLLIKFEEAESNKERLIIILNSIEAVEFARVGDYKNALEKVKGLFLQYPEKEGITKSIRLIQELLTKYNSYNKSTLMEFYKVIESHITLSRFRAGKAKVFYDGTMYAQLALCINYKEDTSQHRTIHKAKGDEFENVILVPSSLDFLLSPDLSDEEARIYYVGLSRAINRLYIVFPKLTTKKQKLIEEKYNIKVEDLTKVPKLN